MKRRLAAIMFTDIVGYSALMSKDEKQAMQVLEKNREIHKALIMKFSGQLIKEIGDGTLSIFQSSVDAVNCALEIKDACKAEPRFRVRIGIHTGDIIIKDKDVYGDGVNIASRIESSGEPDKIYISEKVYDDIRNKSGLNSKFIGEKRFKNIDKPVKIFAVSAVTSKPARQKNIKRDNPADQKSIIVLPFENLSPDPDQEYFSDGLTEEIITDLAQVNELFVVSRTSAMALKGVKKNIREIAYELNVQYVLEGSVRKSGKNLRITAQLIDAVSDIHLWAKKYNGTVEDIFDIQEKVSVSIVKSLEVKILQKEFHRITNRNTENINAYNAYLKGRFFFNKRTKDDAVKSLKYYESAIENDPEFVLAYAGMADNYLMFGFYGLIPVKEAFLKSKEITLQGLAIDDEVSEIHVALGNILAWFESKYQEAGKEFRRAAELSPGNAEAHHMYAHYLGSIGELDGSIEEMKIALMMDPLSVNFNACLGITLFTGGRFEEAIEQLKKTIEIEPDFNQAYYWLGRSYLSKGDILSATESLEKASTYPETNAMAEAVLGYIAGKEGEKEKALLIIEKLEGRLLNEYIDPFFLSLAYMGVDDAKMSMYYLEKGYDEHSMYLAYLLIDPILDPLNGGERFTNLMEKMQLTRSR